jgi:hypothetical protein
MTDERLGPAVSSWLKDTDAPTPDLNSSVRHAMTHVQQTRQLGRRWSLSPFGRTQASAPTTDQTSDHQPTPNPATNARTHHGHTPTVLGRTKSMFSPVKAITAGALIFAVGGAFLIAQPFGQQESIVPGAETDTEAVSATWVTGNVSFAPSCSGPEIVVDGDVRHDWNYECSPQTWTTSDPRLTGEVAKRWNEDVYQTDEGFISVNTSASYLRNDDGGWVCSSSNLYKGFGLFPDDVTGETATCVGKGGYEGLSALLVIDAASAAGPLVGVIFSGDFPPPPEPPAAE